jgi:hypothetical protein
LQFLAYSRRGFKMSEEKQITSAEFGRRLIEDNRELIRIIGTALYPAIEQLKLYQEALKEIRNMKLEERTSYELKVQERAIAWEKEYLSRKNL